MNLFRGAALTSGFSHVHLLIFLCLLKQFDPFCSTILAGGQSSLMLLCPTKLCIKEGSQGWSPWCTCYMIEFDMVNFVETLVMRVPSLVCVSSCCFPIRFHGTFIIMNLAQNVLYVLSMCVCVCVCVCVRVCSHDIVAKRYVATHYQTHNANKHSFRSPPLGVMNFKRNLRRDNCTRHWSMGCWAVGRLFANFQALWSWDTLLPGMGERNNMERLYRLYMTPYGLLWSSGHASWTSSVSKSMSLRWTDLVARCGLWYGWLLKWDFKHLKRGS